MFSENNNQEVIYYADDECRICCNICDKLCIERFYENHLKSETHSTNIRKKVTTTNNRNYKIYFYFK